MNRDPPPRDATTPPRYAPNDRPPPRGAATALPPPRTAPPPRTDPPPRTAPLLRPELPPWLRPPPRWPAAAGDGTSASADTIASGPSILENVIDPPRATGVSIMP